MKKPIAFLSHSSEDADLAERLARDLLKQGVDVWYAQWEIRAGDSLRRKIDAGIEEANFFLALLTPASLKSEWVQTELDAAMVKKIEGTCRLIPILSGIERGAVPATLRGLLWVSIEDYDESLRKLLEACHDVSTKPPVGEPPAWARERPLEGLDLSAHAQRIAAWINQRSEQGTVYDLFKRDAIMQELELTPDEAGMAADELEELGWVKLHRDTGSGPAGFSYIQPTAPLFFRTDPALRGWDPEVDAVAVAAAMVNLASGGGIALSQVDKHLGWGPRRLNPAADYLDRYDYVNASRSMGSAPYTYNHALVNHRTRRFAQAAVGQKE